MKKLVGTAIFLTLLTGVALLAYLMPEVMPESMKSIVLNAEIVLISAGVSTGSFWLLIFAVS